MTSLETGSISEETTKNDTTAMSESEDMKTMSSNNVSSLVDHRIALNNHEFMSLPHYSVDLSHASKDQMLAGPNELFNKNVILIKLNFIILRLILLKLQ
jgi:hypothetical protein